MIQHAMKLFESLELLLKLYKTCEKILTNSENKAKPKLGVNYEKC